MINLVHTRIGKEEGRIFIRYGGRGRNERVLLGQEIFEKGTPNFLGGPVTSFVLVRHRS